MERTGSPTKSSARHASAGCCSPGGPSENAPTMSSPLGRGKNRGGRVPPPSKRIHSIAMLICAPLSAFAGMTIPAPPTAHIPGPARGHTPRPLTRRQPVPALPGV